MDDFYIFPIKEVKSKALNVLKKEMHTYIADCFKDVENLIEPNLPLFFQNHFNYSKMDDILKAIAENEKIGFKERVLESIERLSIESYLIGNDNFLIKDNKAHVQVNSLAYFMSNHDTVKYKTIINDNTYIVKKLFNITNSNLIDKKLKLIFIKDDSGSMGIWENKKSSIIAYFVENLMKLIYKEVECHYITHGTSAQIVDVRAFETNNRSGGTIVSSGYKAALTLIEDIDTSEIDTFFIQLSDGDNLTSDNARVVKIINDLNERNVNCFYFEVNQYKRHSTLISAFKNLTSSKSSYSILTNQNYVVCHIREFVQFFPVLRDNLEFQITKAELKDKIKNLLNTDNKELYNDN